ncbi:MAG: deoxyribodipyrimidine photo-lyase [Bacteroidota bacterium]
MAAGKRYRCVVVWMRRALRVEDNTPLDAAIRDAETVVPVICLRGEQKYSVSTPRREFIRSALKDLEDRLESLGGRLVVRVGDPVKIIPAVARDHAADAVYAIDVYDGPTQARDTTISRRLRSEGREWRTYKDAILFDGKEILAGSGAPYRVYTPFRKAWLAQAENVPRVLPRIRSISTPAPAASDIPLSSVPGFEVSHRVGVASEARRRLIAFCRGGLLKYREQRDSPGMDGTSRLSIYLAHGAISIRTVYWKAREVLAEALPARRSSVETFIAELIWREFYYGILQNFPFVLERSFREEMNEIPWSRDRSRLTAWSEGRTGYPIVDAGMRQLNTEGWMHNRARMIVASFLTKDLHISWQEGEKYFFERLIDADYASNNGGWQWTAGTGTDASPWFRIFNPVLQAKKFDPAGDYIRKYVPELSAVPQRRIHAPWEMSDAEQSDAGCTIGRDYPAPIVDHMVARLRTKELYGRPVPTPHRFRN